MNRRQMEKIAKALSDQTRLRIYEAIASRSGMTCSEVVSLEGLTPATISHHLKILADAELITCHKEGQFLRSQTVKETIARYTAALKHLVRGKKALQ